MQRSWAARPDEELFLTNGAVIAVVSDAAQQAVLWEGQVVQKRLGGYLFTNPIRVPTEIPGEMVTTLYVVTWQDRTNAKAQPETPSEMPSSVIAPPKAETVDEAPLDALDAEVERQDEIEADGFDYTALEDEDVPDEALSR